MRDIEQATTTLISVTPEGSPASGYSGGGALSPDGRYVVFYSVAADLVASDDNGHRDVFLRDMTTLTTTLVSVATDGTQGNSGSGPATVSSDGRYVAFVSHASNLVPGDTNGEGDVFVRDLLLETTLRISIDSNGEEANGSSSGPFISADGTKVLFTSWASNLVAGDDNEDADAFLHNVVSGETTRVSVNNAGVPANGWSIGRGLSADGDVALIHSTATTLLSGNAEGSSNLFVRRLTAGTTTWISYTYDHNLPNGPLDLAAISADGSFVVYLSQADNVVQSDTNEHDDVFLVPVH